MTQFIPGLKLSELFYREVVGPILDLHFPQLKYSAGLIGRGSEVLGFDTQQSRDHHWGPRLLLFLSKADYTEKREKISAVLARKLPPTCHGYSTHFSEPDEEGVQLLRKAKNGELINHRVEILTIESFFQGYLGINPDDKINELDWLTMSQQRLRTIRRGRVFHDGLELNKIRRKLKYYPKDVWLYLLLCQWHRIEQEEPFMARCGDAGDEIGSKILAARLIKDVIYLCFLMEREYAPYSKWFGTAFSRVRCSTKLTPIIEKALNSQGWKEREKNLSSLYEVIAKMHNNLNITEPLPTKVSKFYARPYLVIHADRFVKEIRKKIRSKVIRNIKVDVGSVDQFSDSTDVLCDARLFKKLRTLYR